MDPVERAFLSAVEDLGLGNAKPIEEYLGLVEPGAREELADMLATIFASRPPSDSETVGLDSPSYSRALAALDEVSERAGVAGLLPGALLELRATRGLTPEQVTEQLAEQLAVPAGARRRLDWQYFRLESGQLPGRALSRRLLDALAHIYGTLTEDLQAASEIIGNAQGPTAAPALARPSGGPAPPPRRAAAPEQPDPHALLVDRLFTGGRDA
jgi:hypothetical protein